MSAELIVQLVGYLLGGGGLVALFLISEKKTSAMLDNMNKANEEWQKITTRLTEECDNLRSRKDDLGRNMREREDFLQAKIDRLYGELSGAMRELDAANSRAIQAECFRCDLSSCTRRQPPFGVEYWKRLKEKENGDQNSEEV